MVPIVSKQLSVCLQNYVDIVPCPSSLGLVILAHFELQSFREYFSPSLQIMEGLEKRVDGHRCIIFFSL